MASHFQEHNELLKINQELEAQTVGLFDELDNIRKAQEKGVKPELENPTHGIENSASKMEQDTGHEGHFPSLPKPKSEGRIFERNPDWNTVPDSVANMGMDKVVRFLKAKVEVMGDQLEASQKEQKKLVEKNKELLSERDRVSEDRDKWMRQANSAKTLIGKHEHLSEDLRIQLQSSQAENTALKRLVEKQKKELKISSQCASSNAVKLNRANDDLEKLKETLKQYKMEEKDMKEDQKNKIEQLSGALKKSEKQKMELLHAFKKQLLVIDGLKKQRGTAEAGKLLKTIESDFMEFLDWTPNQP